MSRFTYASGGFLLGAGLGYFFDPARGHRRRARIRDLASHVRHQESVLFGKVVRDASHRVRGVVERVFHPTEGAVSDDVLVGRVRTHLGRAGSHPHAVEVSVSDGTVTLRGPILEREAAEVIRRVARVAGVCHVVDRLERHATADRIPSLQGESRPYGHNELWTPAARGGAIVGGIAVATWGLLARRGLIGGIAGAAGSLLALRGTTNLPLSRIGALVTGRAGIELHKTIMVHAPIDRVFDLWSRFDSFPRFMQHVHSVRVHPDHKRSSWTVDGPGNVPITFEAELVRFEASREIAWQTLPDQRIEHAGTVRFQPGADGTRVHIHMTYRPPGGVIAHAIAHVLGWDPKARIDDDLVRMKALLEEGRTRAHGERVAIAEFD